MNFETEELELILECLRKEEATMNKVYMATTRDGEKYIEDKWDNLIKITSKIENVLFSEEEEGID